MMSEQSGSFLTHLGVIPTSHGHGSPTGVMTQAQPPGILTYR